jgi:hypothetical protein
MPKEILLFFGGSYGWKPEMLSQYRSFQKLFTKRRIPSACREN